MVFRPVVGAAGAERKGPALEEGLHLVFCIVLDRGGAFLRRPQAVAIPSFVHISRTVVRRQRGRNRGRTAKTTDSASRTSTGASGRVGSISSRTMTAPPSRFAGV